MTLNLLSFQITSPDPILVGHWGCKEAPPALPVEACAPLPTARAPPARGCAPGHLGLTHKVRSLGMWLKLDTGMVVMLLLFRVLVGETRVH